MRCEILAPLARVLGHKTAFLISDRAVHSGFNGSIGAGAVVKGMGAEGPGLMIKT